MLIGNIARAQQPPAPRFKAQAEHILLCVWDGMRPDFVTAENTPNLHALAERGTFFANNHAFYITTTEVNGTILATGVFPRRSGILANREYRPAINLVEPIATENHRAVRINDALTDGKHIAVPTVAELVQKAGFSTALAGTKPIALLHDRGHDRTGRGPTLFAGRSYPPAFAKGLEAVMGKFPSSPTSVLEDLNDARPNTPQNAWTTRALIEHLWRDTIPRYSVLWLGDPDFSQHLTAPGSPTALAGIHDSDTHLGLALAALEQKGVLEKTDVFVVSDHGFSTIAKTVELVPWFRKAGIRAVSSFKMTPRPGEVLINTTGGSTSIYIVDKDRALTEKVVALLQTSPFAGPIFTRDGLPGTFKHADARFDTADAPEIIFSFRWLPGENKHGTPGLIWAEGRRPGNGTHGTLSPFEVRNTLVAAGPDIRAGHRSQLPSGNIDVAPTILALLGLEQDGGVDGRVLLEALNGVTFDPPPPRKHRAEARRSTGFGTWTQHLQTTTFAGKLYFDEGNAELLR